ncbi:MAG: MFS transporter, partial [Nocardioidaceae bacterium]
MTQSLALGDVEDDTLDVAGRRRVTATLCLTQITGWGVLFYAFPVLAPSIARDTGWSVSGSAAAFGAGQLTAAAVGIWVGRHLDRRGPRQLMTMGSVLATLALAVLAAAPSLVWFLLGWVLGGVAMAMALYQPAFAAITRWHDDHDRLRALTILTVAGGLASTVFAPLTAVLASTVGWRSTYLILAAGLATITIPAHFWGLRGSWPAAPRALDQVDVRPGAIATSRAFVALTVALTLSALSASAVVVNLV